MSQATITNEEFASYRGKAWLVAMVASLFFFYEFAQLNLFNSIGPYLLKVYPITSTQLGTISSYYFYANALFIIPAGLIIDRYSPRMIITIAMIVCTTATLLFGLVHSTVVMSIARFAIGAGASFCFLSILRIASRWFPSHKLALVTGFAVTWAMLGGMVAQTPFTYLIEATTWKHALIIDALIGYILTVVIWLLVKNYPPNHQGDCKDEHQQTFSLGVFNCLCLVIRNPINWLCGIYTTLLNLPIWILGAIWGILYLSQVHHFTQLQASYATSMLFLGTVIGCPVFGWLSDTIRRRKSPMILGVVCSLLTILYLMNHPSLSLTMVITLFFLLGFFTSSQIISYPLVAELNPHAITSTANSIVAVCIMISGFVVQPLYGYIIRQGHVHTLVNGIPQYGPAEFHRAMLMLPIGFVVALVVSLFLKETRCVATAKRATLEE